MPMVPLLSINSALKINGSISVGYLMLFNLTTKVFPSVFGYTPSYSAILSVQKLISTFESPNLIRLISLNLNGLD